MRNFILWMMMAGMLTVLTGCPTTNVRDEEGAVTEDGRGSSDVDVMSLEEDCKPPCTYPRNAIDDAQSVLSKRLVFFDYDSSNIKPEYEQLIVAHGRYLATYPDVKIRVEGHTDERGSREYNLALGEQRAKAVRKILLLQGAPEANIKAVTFGEEIPLETGHDESAWSQNRRAELVYE
jgi:peptidoglycan-associated lipoprotein